MFLERLQTTLAGAETYVVLSERYAKEPNNVEVVFKLAQKCEGRHTMQARAKELYQKVVALDPKGTSGSYTEKYLKLSIPYTEYAEFSLAQMAVYDHKPDPAPAKAYIVKYPNGPAVKYVYQILAGYYKYNAPDDAAAKAEGTKFFDSYVAKYPEDAGAFNSYVEKIIKDKGPLEKGIELAQRAEEIRGYPPNPAFARNLAQLYILKGEPDEADQTYGKDFIDGVISSTVSSLTGYANFWIEQGKNLDSVGAMADLAAKMAPDSQWYTLQTVAGIYIKLKKLEKALAVFGPSFIQKNMTDEAILGTYASFWSGQGEKQEGLNLESALEAARKAVELTSGQQYNSTLARILFQFKKYQEALPYAEKALELAKSRGYPIAQYDKLLKDIKDAVAKEKGGKVK
jgi:tetratricopeptide (TPR) repeat protein